MAILTERLTESGITQAEYEAWREPREGWDNPSRMNNPVWAMLVDWKASAYEFRRYFEGPDTASGRPYWSFQRFGQSETVRPDATRILIAGEHEDYYDPDFFIYNDVVVIHPDQRIDLYGYRREVFPPTDFHSATPIGDQLVLIGNLGYVDQRRVGQTQVLTLDLKTFEVQTIATAGAGPGWIHRHTAARLETGHAIGLTGGLVYLGPGQPLVDNIDDWALDVNTWTWSCVTHRTWPRWCFRHPQGLHYLPARDLTQRHPSLYQPPIPHAPWPDPGDVDEGQIEYGVYWIELQGVRVRYAERGNTITLTIEGELPDSDQHILQHDLLARLNAAAGPGWIVEPVPNPHGRSA